LFGDPINIDYMWPISFGIANGDGCSGNAWRGSKRLYGREAAPQGRTFGMATAWANSTTEACGEASDKREIVKISLGNPNVMWFDSAS
jgi:hypothetical protein